MKPKKTSKYVTFEDSIYSPKKKLNPHINFEREGKKSNARKVPTEVRCSNCEKIFTLPFKPRKPDVFCDACFKRMRKK
jgi:CxxC-x17-CxxC domain-containing protein